MRSNRSCSYVRQQLKRPLKNFTRRNPNWMMLPSRSVPSKTSFERTDVRAPVRGTIVKLNQYTVGGVIAPGGNILELLPSHDELIIEARVNPNEITHVRPNQHALIRLTALNQRLTPMIDGKVIYLSADIVPEHGSRRPNEAET